MRIGEYFGDGGYFAQAARKVRDANGLPAAVREHAKTLDRSEIAYLLGYAFSLVLQYWGIPITPEDLQEIASKKITFGDPAVFVRAFHDAPLPPPAVGGEGSPKS